MQDGNQPVNRVALTDQIRCLDKTRLRKKAGFVSTRAMNAIKLGLDALFGNCPVPPAPAGSTLATAADPDKKTN